MIFQGDLSTYHPADALMFLSQLGLNGVFTIARAQQLLTLTFKNGFLIDAQSAAGDEKLLQVLRLNNMINSAQDAQIQQIRSETDMSVRQVLAEIKLFPLADIREVLEIGIKDVLLELFLLEEGQFHFTDTRVEPDSADIKLDTNALAITVLSHADEVRNFQQSIQSLDRKINLQGPTDKLAALPGEERLLVHLVSKKHPSVRQLLAIAPLYSHKALEITEKLIDAKLFCLAPVTADAPPEPMAPPTIDPLFAAFKKAFKTLMGTKDVLKRVEAIIGFCKNYYDGILILTAKDRKVIHCKSFFITPGHGIRQKVRKGPMGDVGRDLVFQTVHKTGIGFFGKIFSSDIVAQVATLPERGACALIPVLNQAQLSLFLYAYTEKSYAGVSPHHYLELLSWLITPVGQTGTAPAAQPAGPSEPELAQKPDTRPEVSEKERIEKLISQIKELPPLPSMASKALQLLSDPHSSADSVEQAIAQDQALVAKLIKVSNSVLYGGYQKVSSLRQALTRLGAKTTKSLILAASARSYFLNGQKGMKHFGPMLWQHAVECGVAARRIAMVCGYDDPESAFIAGIMHDIGKLVLLLIDSEKYQEIQRYALAEKITDQVAEAEVLGVSHTVIGRTFMEKWRMPEIVSICAEHHHAPQQAGEHTVIAAIVAYANHLSHALGHRPVMDDGIDNTVTAALMKTIAISPEQNTALIEAVRQDYLNTEIME